MKLTKEQAVVLTGFTGILCCPMNVFHKDVEERMSRKVWSHEFASSQFLEQVKGYYSEDFTAMCPEKG